MFSWNWTKMFSFENSKTSIRPSGRPRRAQMASASCGWARPVKTARSVYTAAAAPGMVLSSRMYREERTGNRERSEAAYGPCRGFRGELQRAGRWDEAFATVDTRKFTQRIWQAVRSLQPRGVSHEDAEISTGCRCGRRSTCHGYVP